MATDGGTPPLTATALVRIFVERNLFDPQFASGGIVRVSIPETAPPGSSVVALQATDNDVSVSNKSGYVMLLENDAFVLATIQWD